MNSKFAIWTVVSLLILSTPVTVVFGGYLILQSYDAITGCGELHPTGHEIVPESDVGSTTVVEFSDLTDEQQQVFIDVIDGEDVAEWPEDRLSYLIQYQGDSYRIEYVTSDCNGLYWGLIVLVGMLYLVVILGWMQAGPWVRRELSG